MSAPTIKAIETSYKGYRFRSRTEARWAVCFDALGVRWEYESEGFRLQFNWYENPPQGVTLNGEQCYLPDFWLPDFKMFAEVKPVWPTPDELARAGQLCLESGHKVLLLDGIPDDRTYWAIEEMSFEHGGWDLGLVEFDVCDGMYKDEKRFWTGGMETITIDWTWNPPRMNDRRGEMEGIDAARAARFDTGYSGPSPRKKQVMIHEVESKSVKTTEWLNDYYGIDAQRKADQEIRIRNYMSKTHYNREE